MPFIDISWIDNAILLTTEASYGQIHNIDFDLSTVSSSSLSSTSIHLHSDDAKDKRNTRRLVRVKENEQVNDDDIVFNDDIDDLMRSTKYFPLQIHQDPLHYSDDDDDISTDSISISDIKRLGGYDLKEIVEKIASMEKNHSNKSPLHPTFQPSSTIRDEKGRAYLVWNRVGNIVTREAGVGQRIEIRFSNTEGLNKPEAFIDNYGFSKASLSIDGAVFSCEPNVDDKDQLDYGVIPGSTIYYHAFRKHNAAEDANETFTLTLPNLEKVTALANGKGLLNCFYVTIFK
jgi:hypothetical protein